MILLLIGIVSAAVLTTSLLKVDTIASETTDTLIFNNISNFTAFSTGDIVSNEFDASFGDGRHGAIRVGDMQLFTTDLLVG